MNVVVGLGILAVALGVIWALQWLYCLTYGVRRLYSKFPNDSSDPSIRSWISWRGDLGLLTRHSLMRIGIGQKHLHIRFFLLPVLFKAPISIPWRELRIEATLEQCPFPIFKFLKLRIGDDAYLIRLRGSVARAVQNAITSAPTA
jgi:hypothetical protein